MELVAERIGAALKARTEESFERQA